MRPAVPVREGGPLAVEGLGERATKWRGGYFSTRGPSLLARGFLDKRPPSGEGVIYEKILQLFFG